MEDRTWICLRHMLVIHWSPDILPSYFWFSGLNAWTVRFFTVHEADEEYSIVSGSRSPERLRTWGPYPLLMACLLLPCAVLHCSWSINTNTFNNG